MHYFQYTAVKFNHDVIQLPFWALAGYAFHAALKRGRLIHRAERGVAHTVMRPGLPRTQHDRRGHAADRVIFSFSCKIVD